MDKTYRNVIIAGVVIVLATGGFAYHTHIVNAREAVAKQAYIESIRKQQDLEDAAQKAKSGAPVVSVEPSKIVPKEPEVVTAATTQPPTQPQKETPKVSTSTNTTIEQPKQPSAYPSSAQVTTSTPVPAPIQQEPVQAIKSLSESDIQYLQSYAQYSGDGVHGISDAYHSFEDMYTNDRGSCDKLIKLFTPITLDEYSKAKAEWLTSPKLVYRNAISQYSIRGILTLTFYSENKLDLTPNVTYQREVEYRLRNTDKLRLENVKYLSEFKAVK